MVTLSFVVIFAGSASFTDEVDKVSPASKKPLLIKFLVLEGDSNSL
jgi:hypothetical protein